MPKTLLLADDSVTIQKVVGISLANEDIKLVTVENGDDAVTQAREIRPDIVLADIVMPGKNGYEVCEAIKGDEALAHTPVLLLTGTFEAFDAERARQAGADGHITKPFEAQALVDQVSQLLARSTPIGEDSVAKVNAPSSAPKAAEPAPSTAPAPSGEETDEAFDFFGGGEAPAANRPGESSPFGGVDLMADSQPSVTPGHADETVLLDASQVSGDPAFDAAVEAAAFDAPGERAEAPFSDLNDSGFDLETADLSMASTVPEVPATPPDLTFSDPAAAGAPAEPSEPPTASEAGDATVAPQPLATVPLTQVPAPPPVPSAEVTVFDVTPAADVTAPDAAPTPPPTAAAEATDPLASFDLAGPGHDPGQTVVDPAGVQSFDVAPSDGDADETVMIEDRNPLRVQSPGDPDATASAGAPTLGSDAIPPELQQQLHATLEKIAWEAFSDLSEQVVKQALARVEAIAWEVIPQMAEVMVREEIARMKEEGEES